MKKNASRHRLKAFFFIYYDQVLDNLYVNRRKDNTMATRKRTNNDLHD